MTHTSMPRGQVEKARRNRSRSTQPGVIAASLMAVAVVAPLGYGYDPTPANDSVMYGDAVTVGNGTARTYIVMDGKRPVEMGVALSEKALDGLPAQGHHGPHVEYLLELPAGQRTPYRFVELDWNPQGHEPDGVYTEPHFDFHFYTIPVEERNAIDPATPDFVASARNNPAPQFLPAGYLSAAKALNVAEELATLPRMGLHWVDPKSPELNGAQFTTTFIYGTWNGKLIFGEPMLTRAFLLSQPDFKAQVPLPQKVATPGYYGSAYRVFWNAETREYRVALSGFTALD